MYVKFTLSPVGFVVAVAEIGVPLLVCARLPSATIAVRLFAVRIT